MIMEKTTAFWHRVRMREFKQEWSWRAEQWRGSRITALNFTESGTIWMQESPPTHSGFWKSVTSQPDYWMTTAFQIRWIWSDERVWSTSSTLSLCHWQPWVITRALRGNCTNRRKHRRTIVENIIPYHGLCLLSDKAVRIASRLHPLTACTVQLIPF